MSRWQERKRPVCLEARYEFADYAELRDFLERAAELSERENYYPDLSFGRDYVNITLHLLEGQGALTDQQRQFAVHLDELAAAPPTA